jgi:hypothetical protein
MSDDLTLSESLRKETIYGRLVHGTYPIQSMKWLHVEQLEPLDAANRLGFEITEQMRKDAAEERMCLFINKGFIVVGEGDTRLHPQADEMFERRIKMRSGCPWPKGSRAIYLHDGEYWLIEKVAEADSEP